MKYICSMIVSAAWIAGFVVAKGFWSTLACIFPFWSIYLVIEFTFQTLGLLP